jgi:hypothetical protein
MTLPMLISAPNAGWAKGQRGRFMNLHKKLAQALS